MSTQKNREILLKQVYNKTDQLLQNYLLVCVGLSFLLASIYDHWHLSISINTFFGFVYGLFSYGFYSRYPRRIVMLLLAKAYPIVFVLLTGGEPFMHTFFVITSMIIMSYQNPFFIRITVVVKIIYYSIMFLLLLNGFAVRDYFWNTPNMYVFEIFVLISLVFGSTITIQFYVINHSQIQLLKQLAFIEKIEEIEKRDELHKEFAKKIAQNELDAFFEPEKSDQMGQILKEMQDKLLEVAQENKERSWTAEGLARFADVLRRNMEDSDKLYDRIIEELVNYLKVNQAALFLVKKDAETVLELVSFYAFEKKRLFNKTLQVGEGLVGQAFLEKQSAFLTDIPTDYIQITSGLGQAPPRNLVVIPFVLNQEVFAVLELASFQILENYQVNFLEKLGESIATTISISEANALTRTLLHKSQQNEEELKAQEEEMRQNLEELQSTQEAMQRKQNELEKLNEKLESSEQILKRTFEKFEKKEQKSIAERRELSQKIQLLEEENHILKLEIRAKDQKIKDATTK